MYCFIALDLEATSKNPHEDEITQIGLTSDTACDFVELVKCNKKN